MGQVTFLTQSEPVDEYGRALYAVTRSLLRAQLDQLGADDLADLNTDRADVTMRQLAKVARLDRDKGLRGDGFEWAIHEAVIGGEPLVTEMLQDTMAKVSPAAYKGIDKPKSLLFGYERAKHLGFLDAVVDSAGQEAVLLPDGRGRPFYFGPWVSVAARGKAAEAELAERIRQVWKTDIFVGDEVNRRYAAVTVKSNWEQLEPGRGLRIGVVPEAKDRHPGIRYEPTQSLWVATLPDPNGFMGLFNDAYSAVAHAVGTLGKHDPLPYYLKASATAQRVQEQLVKYAKVKVVEVEHALDEAAQQDLVAVEHKLVSVEAPAWLHISEKEAPVIAPKPKFEKLD